MSTAHRQYSRKFAAIFTVLALVLALFPVAALAQEQPTFSDIAGLKLAPEIQEAAKAGLIDGYPDGTFKPKQNVTRAEFAKMIVNALEQATGKALPTGEEPFSDVSEDSTLYEYVVKAYNAKLIQGYEDGRFGYSDPIQRQQAAAIIARALGLEETEENFPDVDPKYHRLAGLIGAVAKAGLMQGYDNGNFGPTDNVQRDQAAAIAVRAYNYLLAQKPAVLKVAEVRAVNLKQVEVVFDQPVDKASAENLANYRVYAEGSSANLLDGDGAAAALQADGKTVLLTLEGDAALKNNSKENKIEILTGVKSAAGAALEKAYSTTFAAVDTVTPTAVSVQQIGSRWLEITFSEPVQVISGKVQVRIDNGSIGVKNVEARYASRSLVVTTYAEIKDGQHTVTVLGKTVKDFAGLENQVNQDLKFEAVKDDTVPTVTVASATPTSVKLTFDKPVVIPDSENIRFRAVYNTTKYEIKASELGQQVGSDKLVNEVTLDYSENVLPLGQQKLYIEYVNDSSSDVIKSAFGVTVPEQALDMTITADTTKPVLEKVEVVDSKTLHLVFSEAVYEESVKDLDNYELKDAEGNEVAIAQAKLDADKANVVVLELEEDLQGGTYTLTVSGIEDTAYPRNVMDQQTVSFEAKDMVEPKIATGYPKFSENKIFILFNEPMATSGLGSVLEPKRYTITIDGEEHEWSQKDEIAVSNGDRLIVITLDGVTIDGQDDDDKIKIDFVTDKAGNPLASQYRGQELPLAPAEVTLENAVFTAKNRVEVTFDAALTNVEDVDFALQYGTGQSIKIEGVVNHQYRNGKSVVVLAITDTKQSPSPVDADGTVDGQKVTLSVSGEAATAEGMPLVADSIEVQDGIAPALAGENAVKWAEITFADNSKGAVVNIEFNEDIDEGSFGTESFRVADYEILAADAIDNVIVLTLRPEGSVKTPVVDLLTPVKDLNGNKSGQWSSQRAVPAEAGSVTVTVTVNTDDQELNINVQNSSTALYYTAHAFRVRLMDEQDEVLDEFTWPAEVDLAPGDSEDTALAPALSEGNYKAVAEVIVGKNTVLARSQQVTWSVAQDGTWSQN